MTLMISTTGDRGSPIDYRIEDGLFKIDLNSTYGISQFFLPLGSKSDVSKVTAKFNEWVCTPTGNYQFCVPSSTQSLLNSISGYLEAAQGYEFSELLRERDPLYTANNLGDFESFTNSYVPVIQEASNDPTPSSPVNAPSGSLALGSVLLGAVALKGIQKARKSLVN